MNKIIELTINGKSIKEICQIFDFPYETYINWMQKGKNHLGKIYVEFYNNINKINKIKKDIKNTLLKSCQPNILDKLPKEYNNFYSTSDTGFAWVKKTDKYWTYTRSTNEQISNYSHEDIRELFKIVIENNQLWGVRDIQKAKNSLKNPIIVKKISKIDENSQDNILNPISEQTKEELTQNNEKFESGFAWVTKEDNYWIYSKYINHAYITIKADTLHQLYEKVKTQNLEWGVCNLKNAKYSLENNKIIDVLQEDSDEGILRQLPEDIEKELRKYSKGNKTGFAWVNKINNQWIYARQIKNNNIKLIDENIYRLYEKVINHDYIWGVRDIKKAKKSLKNEKKIEPSIQIKKPNIEEYDILAPLPEEYESSFKSTKINKSGFAWVNKNGLLWQYAGNINDKYEKINDYNIYNLHKKVISQNLIWGVRDIIKAKETLRNEKKPEDYVLNTDIKTDKKVTVNYLTKNASNINIIIKGTIQNDELMYVLLKFKLFEDYIMRILSNKKHNEIDILIELDLDVNLLSKFEKEIKNLGWILN